MTRLSTNSRLNYDPGHFETPIEGIGGMYRFWKSIDSKDRDKLVELFEFGHQNPGEGEPDNSRMDWQSLAEQQKDAYENGYPGPVELMNQGWDYAISDAMKDHSVETPTEQLINGGRLGDTDAPADEPGFMYPNEQSAEELERFNRAAYEDRQARPEAKPLKAGKAAESDRGHAAAKNWRVQNDGRVNHPLYANNKGERLVWPTAPFDYEERWEDD